MKHLTFLLLVLGLAAPLRAERDFRDDHDERRRPAGERVVLYSGENFDGVSVELLPGAVVSDLGDLTFADGRKVNDRISSVRVFGELKVTLYSDSEFRGDSVELADSVARLVRVPRGGANWDNCLSSVRVSGGHGGRPEGRDRDRGDSRDREWGPGRDRDRGPSEGDRPRRHDGPSGAEIERMVTRAYRELLSREPNGAELRRYREAVFTEGWGRDEIYDDIRGSREYRSLEADRIVERVYRDLLGREPDPSGREFWRKAILKKGWTEGRFREEIRDSDEYRKKQSESRSDGRRH